MILLRTLLYVSLLSGHPLHVTITSIDMDYATREVSVTHKFFTDDFTLLFYHLYERNIKPAEGQDFNTADLQIIERYMTNAFIIETENGSAISLEFVRKDQNEDSIWLYFKGELPKGSEGSFSLTNKIMLDLYDDQTNLVIVASEGEELGFTFDYRNRQAEVELGIGY